MAISVCIYIYIYKARKKPTYNHAYKPQSLASAIESVSTGISLAVELVSNPLDLRIAIARPIPYPSNPHFVYGPKILNKI